MFEDMGFTYLGPVDGHNVEQLCTTLSWAREMACPVLLHVRTVKGKGYKPAEIQPERSHGQSRRHGHSMALGDAHVKKPLGPRGGELLQARALRHGGASGRGRT